MAGRVLNMHGVLRDPRLRCDRGDGVMVPLQGGALLDGLLRLGIVYAGRRVARHGLLDSAWRNPYIVGRHGLRDECIARYRVHLGRMLEHGPVLRRRLAEISARGLDLACWCAPQPCHAAVVFEAAGQCGESDAAGRLWACDAAASVATLRSSLAGLL